MDSPEAPGGSSADDGRSTRRAQYHDSHNLKARIRLHRQFSTNPAGWQSWVFAQLAIPRGGRVLELGCGVADLWVENLEHVPPCQIVLSDLSLGMVHESRSRCLGSRSKFGFLVADVQAIPFPEACFDVVVANHMLYHVASLELSLAEIRRVLRPNGRFYASTVGRNDLHELRTAVALFDRASAGEPQEAFCLEGASAALLPWFPTVNLHRYPDGLVITDVEALIAYILSSSNVTAALRARIAELREHFQAQLDKHGAIRITKDAGIVEALT